MKEEFYMYDVIIVGAGPAVSLQPTSWRRKNRDLR